MGHAQAKCRQGIAAVGYSCGLELVGRYAGRAIANFDTYKHWT